MALKIFHLNFSIQKMFCLAIMKFTAIFLSKPFILFDNYNDNKTKNQKKKHASFLKKFVKLSTLTFMSTRLSVINTFIIGLPGIWLSLDGMMSLWCVILTFLNDTYNDFVPNFG